MSKKKTAKKKTAKKTAKKKTAKKKAPSGDKKPRRKRTKPKELRIFASENKNVQVQYLLPDPLNWHLHPPEQRAALSSVFASFGFVGKLLVRPVPNKPGFYYIMDGHERVETLRADFGPEQLAPCEVVDMNSREAKEFLKTYDAIGKMAKVYTDKWLKLNDQAPTKIAGLDQLIAGALKIELPKIEGTVDVEFTRGGKKKAAKKTPKSAKVFQVLVTCNTEKDQTAFIDQMTDEGRTCKAI